MHLLGTRRMVLGTLVLFVSLLSFTSYAQESSSEVIAAKAPPIEQKVTLEFQGVNILDVLKMLSKKSGLNIVAGKNVQGQVSLFLQNVEVMDALATILETSDLAFVEDHGIINVITQKEYEEIYGKPYKDTRVTKQIELSYAKADAVSATLTQMKSAFGKILVEPRTNILVITETPELLKEMLTLIQSIDQPSVRKVFRLRYAKAEDLEQKLQKLIQEKQGSLEIDKKSNRIFVCDTKDRVRAIEKMIRAFDVKQSQVLIEAKIIEVKLKDEFRFGINWQLIADKLGSLDTFKTVATYAVSPPAGAVLSTLTMGKGDHFKVVLQMIEQMGKANTLSSPRLTVLNDEEAKLAVATKQPFVSQTVVQSTTSSTTADNVQFVDVGVTLKVTPVISEDHCIQMKIKPAVSTAGTPVELQGVSSGSNTPFTRTLIPVVTTQELETTVLVKSGTTIVVGGLIQDKQEKTHAKLPILGNIPVLGRAFQSKVHDFAKTELVIFITPTILEPDEETAEARQYFDKRGRLLSHNETGGYIFEKAYLHSQGPVRIDDKPYWEVSHLGIPRYFPLGIYDYDIDPYGREAREDMRDAGAALVKDQKESQDHES